MAALIPTDFATQAEYSTYYLALTDVYHPVQHNMTAFEKAEMDAVLALVPRADTTKLFAVVSGNWNTAGNWYPNGVPGHGNKVLIGEGCTCTYNVNAILTELDTVRVDGNLHTDPAIDTAMLFDTMVITGTGFLRDGTREARIAPDVVHQWIIATSNGLIDVAWDTFMQSRGIISLGRVDVWGARKTPFLEVVSHTGPGIRARSLTLASLPENWAAGDEIVIIGTCHPGESNVGGYLAKNPLQNEKRTLTSVSGATLEWSDRLLYSHFGPQGMKGRTDCKAFVQNLTRNVVFRPDDFDAPFHHRGHLMQMHQPFGWSMRHAEVSSLGRTAKHNGYWSRIVAKTGTWLPATPLPLEESPYWDGSAIIFGPTFLIDYRFVAEGSGTMEIVGTDEDGAAQYEIINYASGTIARTTNTKYFLSITSITLSTPFTSFVLPRIDINARSRQINENGVRNRNFCPNTSDTGTIYSTIKNTINPQGRYAFHWHKLGVSGDILLDPPVLDGVSIHNSPGWLVAQHQTHGVVKNFVGYDAQGAGLVGEDGNETGIWQDCLVSHCPGNDDGTFKEGIDLLNRDPARVGAAFWFTGRNIRVNRCIGAGSRGGHIYNTRLENTKITSDQMDQPTALRGVSPAEIRLSPVSHFVDNQAIAVEVGFIVIKPAAPQLHDVRTPLVRFKGWSCLNGMDITYTQHYSMIDCDVFNGFLGLAANQMGFAGILVATNTSDQTFINPVIEGFTTGLQLDHHQVSNGKSSPLNGRHIVNPTFRGCKADYGDFNTSIDAVWATGDLNSDPVTLRGLAIDRYYAVTGTKHDELGDVTFPFGFDNFGYSAIDGTIVQPLTAFGYYVNTDGRKYVMGDEWFSSRLTGELFKIILPVDVSALSLGPYTNHGNMDLANNAPPEFTEFTVSLARNTNQVIDITGRATGNFLRFGGMQQPMMTKLIDNGDGTITAVPLVDENYTETCYVWVDDANGNTKRAMMTLNVK